MNRDEKINKRKWDYFWEQKWDEIVKFLAWVAIIAIGITLTFVTLYWLGHLVIFLGIEIEECGRSCSNIEYIVNGVMGLMLATMAVLMVSLPIISLTEWIQTNLKKAEHRAKEDFK